MDTAAPNSFAILARHPGVEPVLFEHREDSRTGPPIGVLQHKRVPCTPEAVSSEKLGRIFLATPADAAMELSPACSRRARKSSI